MTNDKKLSLKPLSEIHTYILVAALLLPLILDISVIFTKHISLAKGLLIYRLLIIAGFIIFRLFIYNVKFTVNSECLTKTKGKKVIFKVDVKEIVAIYIKRKSKFDIFIFWGETLLSAFACMINIKPYGTFVSIVYKESSVCLEEIREMSLDSLKPITMKDFFEHNEILSFRKCMKMCKVMGIEPQIVPRKKRK